MAINGHLKYVEGQLIHHEHLSSRKCYKNEINHFSSKEIRRENTHYLMNII